MSLLCAECRSSFFLSLLLLIIEYSFLILLLCSDSNNAGAIIVVCGSGLYSHQCIDVILAMFCLYFIVVHFAYK